MSDIDWTEEDEKFLKDFDQDAADREAIEGLENDEEIEWWELEPEENEDV